jgi:hypothetical protein
MSLFKISLSILHNINNVERVVGADKCIFQFEIRPQLFIWFGDLEYSSLVIKFQRDARINLR